MYDQFYNYYDLGIGTIQFLQKIYETHLGHIFLFIR